MHRVEVKRQLGPGDIDAVSELVAAAAIVDGHRPMGEHNWLDLVEGGRAGFAGLVAWQEGHDHPVGFASLTRGGSSWALEYVVDPHHRRADDDIGTDLVRAALAVVAAEGGGHVHMWVPKPGPMHERIAAKLDLKRGRELYQMRRSLPVDEPVGLITRPFFVGQDEDAWLEVNNSAFAWHPEQGGWDIATLKARQAEPWFDPDGFLLHERDGRLAGFCWTKVHAGHEPPLGEIYVIATDPDFQGLGLGRQLVLAGLEHLARQGLTTGMLYVDAVNKSAVNLYVDLGFVVDHIDRAYVADVTPTADPTA